MPVHLRGALYFATRSPVWGGGRAFYDPGAAGHVLARAHLVSTGQFADIAAQEMYREPGEDLDLGEVLSKGRSVLGAGRYETLICPGSLDGRPVLTFTAPWRMDDVARTAPSAAYLRHLAEGLLEAGAWDVDTVTAYLATCPGTAGLWTERAIAELLEDRIERADGTNPADSTDSTDSTNVGPPQATWTQSAHPVGFVPHLRPLRTLEPRRRSWAGDGIEGDIDDGDSAG
ncbi:histone deacetylase [Streptomyces sp. NBC_00442]|uniref:histone deacetylase n=1 Tax=Streptomyces sp. NBC_00442 TaxID=2903651 RepID=UPI003FA76685